MAVMLPVGPALVSSDTSPNSTASESQQLATGSPADAAMSGGVRREGGATNDNGAAKTWTRSDATNSSKQQSFSDALRASQQDAANASQPNSAGRRKVVGVATPDSAAAVAALSALLATPSPLSSTLVPPTPNVSSQDSAASDTATANASAETLKTGANTDVSGQAAADPAKSSEKSSFADDLKTQIAADAAKSAATTEAAIYPAKTVAGINQAKAGADASATSASATSNQPKADASGSADSSHDLAVAGRQKSAADAHLETRIAVNSASRPSSDSAGAHQGGGSGKSSQDSKGQTAQTVNISSAQSQTIGQSTPTGNDAKVAASTTAERLAVAHQVASQITANRAAAQDTGKVHTVTINIHPDHWGEMKISLSMGGTDSNGGANSGLTATIVTESGAARDALLGQAKELRDALQTAGIKLDKLEVVTANSLSAAAPSHAAANLGFGAGNSQSNSSGHQHSHGQQSSGSAANSSGGQQGRQSGQQFTAMFADERSQPNGGWLPSLAANAAAEAANEPQIPTLGVGAHAASGVNVLA